MKQLVFITFLLPFLALGQTYCRTGETPPAGMRVAYRTSFGFDLLESTDKARLASTQPNVDRFDLRYLHASTNRFLEQFTPNGFWRDAYQWNILNEGFPCTLFNAPNLNAVTNYPGIPVPEYAVGGADMNIWDAWKVQGVATGIKVGVVDTGVRTTHPDLTTVVSGATINYYGQLTSHSQSDYFGHGTFIAGIIAGWYPATGSPPGVVIDDHVVGVAPRASIYAASVDGGTINSWVAGIDWAITSGVKVISLSWGTSSWVDILEAAVKSCQDNGVILVCSARNDRQQFLFDVPVDLSKGGYFYQTNGYTNVIGVTALDQSGNVWTNAQIGTHLIGAPGRNLASIGNVGRPDYVYGSGTSFAAPQVVGVLALMMAKHPTWGWHQIVTKLYDSLDPATGIKGKVNAAKALDYCATCPTVNPAFQPLSITPTTLYITPSGFGGYTVQTSTDLANWTDWTNLTGSVTLPIVTTNGTTFYRYRR